MNWLDRLLCALTGHTWTSPSPTFDGKRCVHCEWSVGAIEIIAVQRRRNRRYCELHGVTHLGPLLATTALQRGWPKNLSRREVRAASR